MAASDWDAGYELTVEIDGSQYPFAVTDVNPKAKLINRANSKYSPGYTINKAGIKSLTFSADGPYKQGEVPIEIGGEYTFLYKPAASHLGVEFLGVVEDMKFHNNVEDGPTLALTVQNSEDFEPVFE